MVVLYVDDFKIKKKTLILFHQFIFILKFIVSQFILLVIFLIIINEFSLNAKSIFKIMNIFPSIHEYNIGKNLQERKKKLKYSLD